MSRGDATPSANVMKATTGFAVGRNGAQNINGFHPLESYRDHWVEAISSFTAQRATEGAVSEPHRYCTAADCTAGIRRMNTKATLKPAKINELEAARVSRDRSDRRAPLIPVRHPALADHGSAA